MPKGHPLPSRHFFCETCGTACSVIGSNYLRKYCSFKCFENKSVINCPICGKFFKPHRTQKWCSELCKNRAENSRRNFIRHRIDEKLFNYLYQIQNGNCAICNTSYGGTTHHKRRILSIDHDHLTGSVRGLLCNNCNKALGLFKDNIKILEKAIKYLQENSNCLFSDGRTKNGLRLNHYDKLDIINNELTKTDDHS